MLIPCLQVLKFETCFQDSAPLAFAEIQSLKKPNKQSHNQTHTHRTCGNAYLTYWSLFFCISFFLLLVMEDGVCDTAVPAWVECSLENTSSIILLNYDGQWGKRTCTLIIGLWGTWKKWPGVSLNVSMCQGEKAISSPWVALQVVISTWLQECLKHISLQNSKITWLFLVFRPSSKQSWVWSRQSASCTSPREAVARVCFRPMVPCFHCLYWEWIRWWLSWCKSCHTLWIRKEPNILLLLGLPNLAMLKSWVTRIEMPKLLLLAWQSV